MTRTPPKIAFIGFGEAAQAFASGLHRDNTALDLAAFDIKTDGPRAAAKQAEMTALSVRPKNSSRDAVQDAELIFSLVTADQAEIAAATAAQTPLNNALFLDCNSCAPDAKRRSATVISNAGGRYVDAAIMAPVHPKLHKTPCLLSGIHATIAQQIAEQLGMSTDIAGAEIGAASTRKMLRSVMIKGLEALTLECFLAARKTGLEQHVLASLEASFPGFNWAERAPYMMERAMTHGTRRAAEMREVAQTLRDLGLAPDMATATATRQQDVGALGLDASAMRPHDLGTLSDAILAALPQTKP